MILRGRTITPGRARGRVLLSHTPVSFLGGVDGKTGAVLDPKSDAKGRRLRGRVFAFPRGAGSTVGSYVLYGLAKWGIGPAAVVVEKAEAIVAAGAILGRIPAVDRIDSRVFLDGDLANVDGRAGTVDLPGVEERPVVTAFLENKGRILVVRRSRTVGTFRGRWSGVSGYLEKRTSPLAQARREIAEETRLRRPRLLRTGPVVLARHGAIAYRVYPFLFHVDTRRVRLDWENVEARWLPPSAIPQLPTVPRLPDVLAAVLDAQPGRPQGT